MKKILYTLSLVIFVVGCGDVEDFSFNPTLPDKPAFFIDETLKSYLEQYDQFLVQNNIDRGLRDKLIRMEFSKELQKEFLLGKCFVAQTKKKKTIVGNKPSRVLWSRVEIASELIASDMSALRFVVFHELTHCYFEIDHIDNRFHIMNPSISSFRNYDDEWESLAEDLATSIKSGEARSK